MVQNENGVRVEDYLATLAAATGEAALAAAGFDVAHHTMAPGSGLFFEPVNDLLAQVYEILSALAELPPPDAIFEHVARTVGHAEWGKVVVTVPEGNDPWILPLRAAYELRSTVAGIEAAHGFDARARHIVTATALREAIVQVDGAIDFGVAMQLALEVTFGMAKMAPMTDAALAAAE
jgi:hypothetical protein